MPPGAVSGQFHDLVKRTKINYVHAERPAAAVHEGARAGAAENGVRLAKNVYYILSPPHSQRHTTVLSNIMSL